MTIKVETENLGSNGPGGTTFGNSSARLIAFYGATPVAQQTGISPTATSLSVTAATVSGVFGFSTQTAYSNAMTMLNGLWIAAQKLGLIGS